MTSRLKSMTDVASKCILACLRLIVLMCAFFSKNYGDSVHFQTLLKCLVHRSNAKSGGRPRNDIVIRNWL